MSKVVAKKVLLNQTALIAAETIFTSCEGGDFLVHVYTEIKSASVASGQMTVGWSWTDNLQLVTQGINLADWAVINQASFGQANLAHLAPNSNIAINTTGTPPPAGSFYNIYVTVQELSGPQF
jgi:hypothetical protein